MGFKRNATCEIARRNVSSNYGFQTGYFGLFTPFCFLFSYFAEQSFKHFNFCEGVVIFFVEFMQSNNVRCSIILEL